MRDQFLVLAALQRLDDQLRTLRAEQDALPKQLQPYQRVCAEARQQLTRFHDDIEHAERRRRALERELESLQTQLARTQQKLHGVKTNREYSALLAEIDTGKQHIAALEDQVLELMELLDQQRQASKQQEQRVQTAEQEHEAQQRQIAQLEAALGQRRAAEEVKRQRLVAELGTELYGTYQRIATMRHGQAVVIIRDGTCEGCYLKIQPQLVSEIRRQDRLTTCPHCQRVLLWPLEEGC